MATPLPSAGHVAVSRTGSRRLENIPSVRWAPRRQLRPREISLVGLAIGQHAGASGTLTSGPLDLPLPPPSAPTSRCSRIEEGNHPGEFSKAAATEATEADGGVLALRGVIERLADGGSPRFEGENEGHGIGLSHATGSSNPVTLPSSPLAAAGPRDATGHLGADGEGLHEGSEGGAVSPTPRPGGSDGRTAGGESKPAEADDGTSSAGDAYEEDDFDAEGDEEELPEEDGPETGVSNAEVAAPSASPRSPEGGRESSPAHVEEHAQREMGSAGNSSRRGEQRESRHGSSAVSAAAYDIAEVPAYLVGGVEASTRPEGDGSARASLFPLCHHDQLRRAVQGRAALAFPQTAPFPVPFPFPPSPPCLDATAGRWKAGSACAPFGSRALARAPCGQPRASRGRRARPRPRRQVKGFGETVGRAMALLHVVRHGLRCRELWSLLSALRASSSAQQKVCELIT